MAGVTNRQIMDKIELLLVGQARHDEKLKVVDDHHKILLGNGRPGLVSEWTTWKGYAKGAAAVFSVVITLLGVAQALTACQASGNLASAIDASNTQLAQQATYAAMTPGGTPTGYPTQTATASDTATPRATLTPWTPVTVTPHASTTPINGVVEIDADAVQWLARLCWVESRSFGEARLRVCANILSTVFRRTTNRELSAGDIYSTLTWDCKTGDETCQFPAWVTQDGCEGIVICPDFDEEGMLFYRGVVMNYLLGYITPSCPSRLYYGNQPHDMIDCVIEGPHQEREGFHD